MTEDQPSQCPSCHLSGNVPLSLSSRTQRKQGGEGHRQKRSSSVLSGATETGELRLSLCTLLFPGEEWGVEWAGRLRTVSSENGVVFCWVIRPSPFKGYKMSQSLGSLTRLLSPINYTTWKKLWTLKNNIGVWCLEELECGMPACQVQSAAYPKRVLGTRVHTPTGTGGPQKRRVPTPARVRRPTAPCFGLNGFPGLFQLWKGQHSPRQEAPSSPLEEAAEARNMSPEFSLIRVSSPHVWCCCICDTLVLSQKDPTAALSKQHAII